MIAVGWCFVLGNPQLWGWHLLHGWQYSKMQCRGVVQ